MTDRVPTIDILGIPFARLTPEKAVDAAERLYEREEPGWIAIENVHALNLARDDPANAEVLRRADHVFNDGKGVMLGARILGHRFPADLNGNVTTPLLLERAAAKGWPTYFLGAAPGVTDRAKQVLEAAYPGLKVVGTHSGFIAPDELDDVLADIRSKGTGWLVVGMGMPLQERWVDRHLHATGARLATTAGAFFDFQTGEVKRAPGWMGRYGLEWVHRLFQEPRRMWRRYLIGNPLFLARVVRQRLARKRSA